MSASDGEARANHRIEKRLPASAGRALVIAALGLLEGIIDRHGKGRMGLFREPMKAGAEYACCAPFALAASNRNAAPKPDNCLIVHTAPLCWLIDCGKSDTLASGRRRELPSSARYRPGGSGACHTYKK